MSSGGANDVSQGSGGFARSGMIAGYPSWGNGGNMSQAAAATTGAGVSGQAGYAAGNGASSVAGSGSFGAAAGAPGIGASGSFNAFGYDGSASGSQAQQQQHGSDGAAGASMFGAQAGYYNAGNEAAFAAGGYDYSGASAEYGKTAAAGAFAGAAGGYVGGMSGAGDNSQPAFAAAGYPGAYGQPLSFSGQAHNVGDPSAAYVAAMQQMSLGGSNAASGMAGWDPSSAAGGDSTGAGIGGGATLGMASAYGGGMEWGSAAPVGDMTAGYANMEPAATTGSSTAPRDDGTDAYAGYSGGAVSTSSSAGSEASKFRAGTSGESVGTTDPNALLQMQQQQQLHHAMAAGQGYAGQYSQYNAAQVALIAQQQRLAQLQQQIQQQQMLHAHQQALFARHQAVQAARAAAAAEQAGTASSQSAGNSSGQAGGSRTANGNAQSKDAHSRKTQPSEPKKPVRPASYAAALGGSSSVGKSTKARQLGSASVVYASAPVEKLEMATNAKPSLKHNLLQKQLELNREREQAKHRQQPKHSQHPNRRQPANQLQHQRKPQVGGAAAFAGGRGAHGPIRGPLPSKSVASGSLRPPMARVGVGAGPDAVRVGISKQAAAARRQLEKKFQVNGPFDWQQKFARMFVVKAYSPMDVLKSVKYGVWSSNQYGNRRLDASFRKSSERGPVFLLFSVNGSGGFCGLAKMASGVDHDKANSPCVPEGRWFGQFKVTWLIVKSVPNQLLHHIRLPNNNGKPVTFCLDAQEVLQEQARPVLQVLAKASTAPGPSVLDAFPTLLQQEQAYRARQRGARKPMPQRKYRNKPRPKPQGANGGTGPKNDAPVAAAAAAAAAAAVPAAGDANNVEAGAGAIGGAPHAEASNVTKKGKSGGKKKGGRKGSSAKLQPAVAAAEPSAN